mmetsp:Transcript_50581/g.158024  ORF Transcript_50581/g.158024 Transcript_50581/m.158024 type:complete len:350 (-) Transcript_50581:117-1166(-)
MDVVRVEVFEPILVGDLARSPWALVVGVVDLGGVPFALVGRVADGRALPLSASYLALRVVNDWGFPVSILLVIPVIRLLGIGIRNTQRLVVVPPTRLLGVSVLDVLRESLIPVSGLAGLGIIHLGFIDPIRRLDVIRVVDLLGRVHRRVHVLEQAALHLALHVHKDLERVVRADDKRVQVSHLVGCTACWRPLGMLLLPLLRHGVLVLKDEVNLVGAPATIRPEHDGVSEVVIKLLQLLGRVLLQQLDVRAVARQPVHGLDLILHDKRRVLHFDRLLKGRGERMFLPRASHPQPIILRHLGVVLDPLPLPGVLARGCVDPLGLPSLAEGFEEVVLAVREHGCRFLQLLR